jgi:hypothetical protein
LASKSGGPRYFCRISKFLSFTRSKISIFSELYESTIRYSCLTKFLFILTELLVVSEELIFVPLVFGTSSVFGGVSDTLFYDNDG